EVVLPGDGPIVSRLRNVASRIVFEPLWVLRRADIAQLATIGLFRLAPALRRAVRRFRSADLVYINTAVVVDYLLAARWFRAKTLVHIHERPDGIALTGFRLLLRFCGAELIFNSQATRAAYRFPPGHAQHVVYNCGAIPAAMSPAGYDGARL